MDSIKKQEIKCDHCGVWFINNGIVFGEMEIFDKSIMQNNRIQCSNCGKMTGCNKENMRLVANDSGFRGNDTF